MARRRYGSSASALIRTANAARERQDTYNDQIAAFEFQYGPQDQASFNKYRSYLQGRISKGADPSKALSLQKTLIGAQRTFTSNLIQERSLDIMRGDYTEEQKQDLLHNLAVQAYNNGDFQQGQALEAKYYAQINKVQGMHEATAARYSASQEQNYKSTIGDIKDQIDEVDRQFKKTGSFTPLKSDGKPYIDPKTGKEFSLYGLKSFLYQAIQDKTNEALQSGSLTEAQAKSLIESANKAIDKNDYQKNARYLELERNGFKPQAATVTDYDEHGRPLFGFKDTNVTAIHTQFDEKTGKFVTTPVFDPNANINSKTGLGEDKFKQIMDSLKLDGLNPQEKDGNIYITDPNDPTKTQVMAIVQASTEDKSGNVRFVSADGKVHNVIIDSNPLRPKNEKPVEEVSDPQLQAEEKARQQQSEAALNPKTEAPRLDGPYSGNANLDRRIAESRASALAARAQFDRRAAEQLKALESARLAAEAAKSTANLAVTRQNSLNQGIVGAPAAPIVPKAPSTSYYLPPPIVPTAPADVFKATLPTNPTNSQIAKSLGISLGYNF